MKKNNKHFIERTAVWRKPHKAYHSIKLKLDYLATEEGIIFENGVWYSAQDLKDLAQGSIDEQILMAIHASKHHFDTKMVL